MSYIILVNISIYILSYKIISKLTKSKYYFPFRRTDILNLLFNLFAFIFINFFFKIGLFVEIILINFLLFYCMFHIVNMVETSPRTKILIDLLSYAPVHIKKYQKFYNENTIVENRLARFLTTKQIVIKNKFISINLNNKISLLIIIQVIYLAKV